MKRTFTVTAHWDDKARVWFSESDITGLHIEAETVEAFERELHAHALDLVVANHVTKEDLATSPLAELIPAIFWRADDQHSTAAE